jgi:hypothetical protein
MWLVMNTRLVMGIKTGRREAMRVREVLLDIAQSGIGVASRCLHLIALLSRPGRFSKKETSHENSVPPCGCL